LSAQKHHCNLRTLTEVDTESSPIRLRDMTLYKSILIVWFIVSNTPRRQT